MGITPDTIVWAEDIVDWIPAYQVSELNSLFASTSAQTPPPYQEPSSQATEALRYDTIGPKGSTISSSSYATYLSRLEYTCDHLSFSHHRHHCDRLLCAGLLLLLCWQL